MKIKVPRAHGIQTHKAECETGEDTAEEDEHDRDENVPPEQGVLGLDMHVF